MREAGDSGVGSVGELDKDRTIVQETIMRRPTPKKLDAITLLAQAGAAKRRRPRLVPSLVAAAVVVALLSLIAWWAWPQPQPEFVILAAYDDVVRAGEPATLRAQVEATGTDSAGADMAGYELYFEQTGGDWHTKVTTDKNGVVALEHAFAGGEDELAYYLVRCPKGGRRAGTPEAGGRVFSWPADAALLVIDADHALADADPERLRKANNFDIRPLPESVAALRKARANYRVVYLSAAADLPEPYLKLRAWLRRDWLPVKDQFPDGPLLGRAWQPGAEDAASFHQAAVTALKERFPGQAVGLTRNAEVARAFHTAGLRTILIGKNEEGLEGVTAVPAWSDVPKLLAE